MSPDQIVSFLVRNRLLARHELIREQLRIEPVSSRNQSFQVRIGASVGFFIKHADEATRPTLANEAQVYAALGGPTCAPEMRSLVPGFCCFDPDDGVLVLELCAPTRTAREFLTGVDEETDLAFARAWASAIATYHSSTRTMIAPGAEEGREFALPSFLSSRLPWALEIARPGTDALRMASGGQLEVIKLIQRRPNVCRVIDEFAARWSPTGLIHGDLKPDNILVREDPIRGALPRLLLVDWELASAGDLVWEVGAVFRSYLIRLLFRVAVEHSANPGLVPGEFAAELSTVWSPLHAFWDLHVRYHGMDQSAAADQLRRGVIAGAIQLLQTAFEWSFAEPVVPAPARWSLQLGINLLQQPEEGLTAVLGFGPPGGAA